ncbi:MAG: S26 family signal peptidase [Candidatus Levybacteria bacterium]|nr:S26 family signal peptidase [Candidatus Levybacteria bacterium]
MLLSRFKISGHSMTPTYSEGDNVLVSSLPLIFTKPKKRDVVVFEKFNRFYIKRIDKMEKGKYFLVGDNKKDSFDSRRFGSVKREQIKAKVILKI